MKGVRLRPEGWEGQCDSCREWFPLDVECWLPRLGMRRCRACHYEERRVTLKEWRRNNPEARARHSKQSGENAMLKRKLDRESYLEYQRRWWARNSERLMAEAAERHAIKLEIEGRTPRRRSPREETPTTLAYRAEFRRRWVEKHGPIVAGSTTTPVERLERQRERKREWMRNKRAAEKAA